MKHEEAVMQTRKMLAQSLKKQLLRKPFSKVTVSEITRDCNVNRKTFYYHFEDMYALLKWMLEQEAIEVFKKFDLMVDYPKAVIFVIDYIEENKQMLSSIVNSIGREQLRRVFYPDFMGIVHAMIEDVEKQYDIHTAEKYKQFLGNLYTESLVGVLVASIQSNEKLDRDLIQSYISVTMRASLSASLKAAQEENL